MCHLVGAMLPAQLRIRIVNDAGAADVAGETGGIPTDGLGIGR